MADDTLTPMEVFALGHALDRMVEQFGDDALLSSAREKLDRVFQRAQERDPELVERIKAQRELMETGQGMARAEKLAEKARAVIPPHRWGWREDPFWRDGLG